MISMSRGLGMPLRVCHLARNGHRVFVEPEENAQYPRFIANDATLGSQCFEATGRTEDEALANAKRFRQEWMRKHPNDFQAWSIDESSD